ncbi:MAG: DUF5696 domain-containing protein [Candidatus Izemoplasmatales bacterium]
MNKKILVILLVSLVVGIAGYNLVVNAINMRSRDINYKESSYNISTDSNFFGEVENQALVDLPEDYEAELSLKGFKFVAETSDLELYVKENYFNLAIYDKASGYLWYSVNPNYLQYMLSGTSRFFVESGVIIEYYNMDNIAVEDNKSYVSGPKFNVSKTYEYNDSGLVAHIDFEDLGITFDVVVSIEEDRLRVSLPIETLVEEDVEKTMLNLDGTTSQKITQYRLKSVYLFPYFGSNNYEINGYSLVPDGSGALIRYNEEVSSTAYIKRIYGADEGVNRYREENATYYIREEMPASMPIFGVNHGYQQAAFLAVVSEGDGYSEIHSYPYGYNSYRFNTTFAKFIVRERLTVQTSSNSNDSFTMIGKDPYPSNFTVDYYFLNNEEASYSGMAKKYREILEIDNISNGYKTNITLIGQDFKNGLFGKDYVEMTTYEDVMNIVKDLNETSNKSLELIYQAWNKGGLYGNTPFSPKISSNLGSSSDFEEMNQYLNDLGINIFYLNNPIISYTQGLGKKVISKPTLSVFATNEARTSLYRTTYYLSPDNVSDSILKYDDNYQKLGINALALQSVGDSLFTYRYSSKDYYRDQMISILQNELNELNSYNLALYQPNSYLWKYLDNYLNTPVESNKYAYVTDSIPFIQLVLVGSVNLSSNYINYVSDYDLLSQRLVEYGVNPAFLLTQESTHNLRFTNSEFVYTSEYSLWKDTILEVDEHVSEALSLVNGLKMINHRYVDNGVSETTYENGIIIYVNYNSEDIVVNSVLTIPSNGYKVVSP